MTVRTSARVSETLAAKLEALRAARVAASTFDADRLATVGFLAAKADTALLAIIPALRYLANGDGVTEAERARAVEMACVAIRAASEEFDSALRQLADTVRRLRELEEAAAEALTERRASKRTQGEGIQ